MSGETLRITIQNACSVAELPSEAQLKAWIGAALVDAGAGELTLRLVGESEAADLNARYRGREGPTNVLSFPAEPLLPSGYDEPAPLGDIVICAPLIAAEAEAEAKPVEAHWAHVVIHGALHLAGYDHEADADAERMEARERQILAGFGIADPYAAP